MAAQEKMELRKTGGGIASNIHDPTYETILSLMNRKTVKGLHNEFDNDKDDTENNSYYDVEVLEDLTEEMYSTEVDAKMEEINGNLADSKIHSKEDWGNYCPILLKKKSSCLEVHKPSSNIKSNTCNRWEDTSNSTRTQCRRPVLKELSSSNISKQYSDLAEIKLQLAQTQLKALQSDINKKEEQVKN